MEVFIMTIEESAKLPENFCRELFPMRLEDSRRFRRNEDRLRSIGAGALLSCIAGLREENILTDEHGKRSAPGSGIEFSISHSGDYSVLALDDSPVGVDIEEVNPRHLSVAKRVYTEAELLWISRGNEGLCEITPPVLYSVTASLLLSGRQNFKAAANRLDASVSLFSEERRFHTLWTMKEAILKAEGHGLYRDPAAVDISPFTEGQPVSYGGSDWLCESGSVGGCQLSVCYRTK